ncbi:UDP-N-acetylmuramoyl-L-alanyl-D-glutamate--2,6-diaminopimelate ligase [Nocardia miyunensis]|uniref:UDP-N-acetylmuramoyl-L-alanyl-D-glutamate--2, 6-diaminopimelate ligase n=1 Tax=Nocardia miyunensis TaxID=282684 RepID=UPI00083774D7|nr:UDP-N-acetylmuramoyl-L-alanyl-D-glutamate--2,6-diaminopimelate ligase [Nocardia miyunensis]
MPVQPSPQVLRPAVPPSTELQTVVELTGARLSGVGAGELSGVVITGIEQRSNAVQAGDLFAGLAGAHAHGARFAADAVERGAVAVLTDAAGAELIGSLSVPVLVRENPRAVLGELSASIYGNPSQRLQVLGITGTSGKTTTSYLVEAGLSAAGLRTALIGTIETRIGGQRVPSALTTPEAPQLHAMFALMVEQGVQAVVMEVSSHALALGRVDGVRFAVGAFTNLSQDHLDFHADFEDYYAAKRKLFVPDSHTPLSQTSSSWSVAAQTCVICVDDAWGRRLAREVGGRAPVVAVSTGLGPVAEGAEPDWSAVAVTTLDGGEQQFTAVGPGVRGQVSPEPSAAAADSAPVVKLDVRLRLPGRYNIANGLLAIAVCAAAGVDPRVAARALAEVDVPGRMQRVDCGQDFLAVVDYAHKPAAVESVIATLREYLKGSNGRLAVVVGAGGDRDAGKRPLMGATAARGAELVIITDDNPRSEDPAAIRAAVGAGALGMAESERGEVTEIGDRAAAIAAAVDWARSGDVVLVAGKGHETGQEIAGVKYPFDDREVLAEALCRRSAPDDKDLTVS